MEIGSLVFELIGYKLIKNVLSLTWEACVIFARYSILLIRKSHYNIKFKLFTLFSFKNYTEPIFINYFFEIQHGKIYFRHYALKLFHISNLNKNSRIVEGEKL